MGDTLCDRLGTNDESPGSARAAGSGRQPSVRRNLLRLAVITTTLALSAAAWAEDIGFVAATHGDVSIDRGDRGVFKAAQRDGGVAVGDRIRTGLDSSAKIVLTDDTLLQIDEDTELLIETFHVGAAATKERSILRQTRGRLRATVGDAFGASTKLEVHIPTAAIGVKGTDFEVVKAALWEACLISGGIDVSNDFGAASPRPGYCVYAYADKAPGDEFPNPRSPLDVKDGGDDFQQPIDEDVAAEGDPPLDPFDSPFDPDDPKDPLGPDDPFRNDADELENFRPLDPGIEPEPEPDPGRIDPNLG